MNWRPLETRADIEAALDEIDAFGVSSIPAPPAMASWTLDECAAYGELAAEYGLRIAELGYWENLGHPDPEIRDRRIGAVRGSLARAEAAGVQCVVTLAGTFAEEGALAPHPQNWSPEARARLAENTERILEGLDLRVTTYALEPWCNGFFHEPEEVADFLRGVGHPRLRLHLDQMNMHGLATYYRSSEVIDRTFDLLADLVVAVHAKDLLWNPGRMFLLLEEVVPGHGVLDYPLFVRRLAELPEDVGVFTEHWATVEEYHEALAFLRATADAEGVAFAPRTPAH